MIPDPRNLIMVPNTMYEENPCSHHGGMCEDGLTDRQIGSILTFPDSTIVEWGIICISIKSTIFSRFRGQD